MINAEAVPSAERFNYLFDGLNIGSTSVDRVRHLPNNYNDQERYKFIHTYILMIV